MDERTTTMTDENEIPQRIVTTTPWWEELLQEKSHFVGTLLVLIVIVLASAVYRSRQHLRHLQQEKEERVKTRAARAENPFATKASTSSTSQSKTSSPATTPSVSRDVWEERRQKGIAAPNSSNKNNLRQRTSASASSASDKKGFQSSYYYAHNSSNSKGGYADGLQLEDYTMNGPRLLSKGGKPVNDTEDSDDPDDSNNNGNDNENDIAEPSSGIHQKDDTFLNNSETAISNSGQVRPRYLAITKYLWDDPGDSTGVATIRIDSLPNPNNSSELVPWKDAQVQETSATLTGADNEGLLVIVTTTSATAPRVEYRLEIPQLYGEVTSVTAVTKTKRLLVRLQKTKVFWDRSVLKEWPHPHKKKKQ